MNHLEELIAIQNKYGFTRLLVPSLDGGEREYLRLMGYKFKSVEPTHCEIFW